MTHVRVGPAANQLVTRLQHDFIAPVLAQMPPRPEPNAEPCQHNHKTPNYNRARLWHESTAQDSDRGALPIEEQERKCQEQDSKGTVERRFRFGRWSGRFTIPKGGKHPVHAEQGPDYGCCCKEVRRHRQRPTGSTTTAVP